MWERSRIGTQRGTEIGGGDARWRYEIKIKILERQFQSRIGNALLALDGHDSEERKDIRDNKVTFRIWGYACARSHLTIRIQMFMAIPALRKSLPWLHITNLVIIEEKGLQ
jgi:hypothetical protein